MHIYVSCGFWKFEELKGWGFVVDKDKEYKTIHDSFQTSDYYAQNVCLRAFEHLREREVICYAENRGQSQAGEYRPMKLLISASELHQGMRSHACCPAILLKLLDH